MKPKEGRDYLALDCGIAKVLKDNSILISTMSESIIISTEEFDKLSKFLKTKLNENKL